MDGMNQNNNNLYGQQADTYQNSNPYQPQNNYGVPPVQPYNPNGPKKGFGVKLAIGIACAVVLLIAVCVGVLMYSRNTPSYKVRKGIENLGKELVEIKNPLAEKLGLADIMLMMQEDGGHVDTKLDFTIELPIFGDTTVGIDTDFYKDVHAKELSADTSLSVLNIEFAHLNIYANDEVFCFSVPELFIEDMYIENENVISQYNNSILADGSELDMEDFSINLFPDKDTGITMRDWRNLTTTLGDFEKDFTALRDAMTIEKVEKGLYRVTFPAKEVDRMVKDFMEYYEDVADYGGVNTSARELSEILKEYKKLVTSDVNLLFEIDSHNRINSIMLENPLEALDGEASFEAEVFFLGEERSADKVQGKFVGNGVDGKRREAIWQVQEVCSDDAYDVDVDFKWTEEDETVGKVKFVMNCDAVKDKVNITCSIKDDESETDIVMKSRIDDYDKGESIEIDLDEISVIYISDDDRESSFKISGDILVEPLQGKIEPSVEPETAFFEMSLYDWMDIIEQLNDEYGYLLDALLW
ncbi:MAG: hypothetical protein J1F42_13995 [Lachnospiraceae bacterium]|nr:hypothetical protein [Lachnospiraceae bacterium]